VHQGGATHKNISPKKRDQVDGSREGKSRIRPKEKKCMYLLSWIIIGLVAGWSAGKILKGNGYGLLMDIVIGIGGAVAGGFLIGSAGFSGYQGTIYTTLVAIIGAVLLTLLVGFVNGGRLYARQL
jgi:uncharacterized membrane protein YeaQ/YmgE (transglycosylase-associated protein family)